MQKQEPAEIIYGKSDAGKTFKPLPEEVIGVASHVIDIHGNAGVGQVARLGTCSSCGRDNKIVGPKDADPDDRTCFGGCNSQRGLTQWDRKLANMGWDPRGTLFDMGFLEEYLEKLKAELAAVQAEDSEEEEDVETDEERWAHMYRTDRADRGVDKD